MHTASIRVHGAGGLELLLALLFLHRKMKSSETQRRDRASRFSVVAAKNMICESTGVSFFPH